MNFVRQILEAQQVALFLDFDGTLAPIVPRPSEAALPPGTRMALERLCGKAQYLVAFVSGRSVEDLIDKAAMEGPVYAGNHGLEIRGRGLNFSLAEDPQMSATVATLRRVLESLAEVEVEDKGLSASVHFRRLPPELWGRVDDAVRAAVPSTLEIREGKMVFEIRPRTNWNKGSAVCWILEQFGLQQACHVYVGDDLTDEDAFAVLPDGVTIHVGSLTDTRAKYRLKDTVAVEQFLTRLANG